MKTFLLIVLICLVIYFLIGETHRSRDNRKGLLEGAASSVEFLFSDLFLNTLKVIGWIITAPFWLIGNALTGKMNYGLLFIIIAIIAFL